ncbi:uncharacterized protein LOC132277156 [Cornus florida]|uniref:uncharacterized protein LOC132277156 n=1 Tax=Cornus florida TaxID=4283 RepID=UPI00289B27D8|nr:uncharacterized protein LOC132277156 [Cornus florida]
MKIQTIQRSPGLSQVSNKNVFIPHLYWDVQTIIIAKNIKLSSTSFTSLFSSIFAMSEQRPAFRFRLPWLPTAPAAPPPPPTTETPAPTQPTTTTAPTQPAPATSAQRPPFRPAGLAPVQPPPQAQPSTRTESQPPSPARGASQSRVASQPSSPSRPATQSRATSQPSSPSRPATQSRATSQPSSPSRPTTQSQATAQPSSPSRATPQPRPASLPSSQPASQPRAASQPSSQPAPQPRSPSRLASQPAGQTPPPPPSLTPTQMQPTEGAITQPPSPPKKLEPTTPKSPQPTPSTTQPPPSAAPEKPVPAKSQTESKEPLPKTEIISTNVRSTQNQTPAEKTIQPEGMAPQSSEVLQPIAATPTTTPPAPTEKRDSSSTTADTKPFPESVGKIEETQKGQEEVQEVGKEGKTNGAAIEEPKQRATTEPLTVTSSSDAPAKEQPTVPFQAEQKRPGLDTKERSPTSGSDKRQEVKDVKSPLKDKNTVSESRQKPSVTNGERVPLQKELKDDVSKFLLKMGTGQTKHPMDDKPATVITLAGENRGASMQLGSDSAKREGSIHIRRGYKTNPDETADSTTTDGEGSSRRRSKDARTTKDETTKAYVNSNAQGINNSIVFNSSVNEQSPGVKLFISHNPPPVKPSNRTESSLDAHKARFSITPAQKLTYEPTVKRRCLRGLFMESSDSDPDNPEKPRRHGCRYNSTEKRSPKDGEIDVL